MNLSSSHRGIRGMDRRATASDLLFHPFSFINRNSRSGVLTPEMYENLRRQPPPKTRFPKKHTRFPTGSPQDPHRFPTGSPQDSNYRFACMVCRRLLAYPLCTLRCTRSPIQRRIVVPPRQAHCFLFLFLFRPEGPARGTTCSRSSAP